VAAFGRVPVRSLADFRLAASAKPDDKKRKTLQSLSLEATTSRCRCSRRARSRPVAA